MWTFALILHLSFPKSRVLSPESRVPNRPISGSSVRICLFCNIFTEAHRAKLGYLCSEPFQRPFRWKRRSLFYLSYPFIRYMAHLWFGYRDFSSGCHLFPASFESVFLREEVNIVFNNPRFWMWTWESGLYTS